MFIGLFPKRPKPEEIAIWRDEKPAQHVGALLALAPGVQRKVPQKVSSICCNHTKLLLDQFAETRSSAYESRLLNQVLQKRHWSAELLIESLWWSLSGNASHKDFGQSLKKSHIRGSPFYIGVSLIKLSSYGDATKLDFTIHTFRTEYSPGLADYLTQAKQCLEQYRSSRLSRRGSIYFSAVDDRSSTDGSPFKPIPKPGLLINAKVTDITSFFFNKYDTCILANLNELSLAKTPAINVVKLDQFHRRCWISETSAAQILRSLRYRIYSPILKLFGWNILSTPSIQS